MSNDNPIPIEVTHHIRDRCLCLHLHRAARAVGRIFDADLRPLDLTNGQFSLMMALNRADPPRIGQLAGGLAMDRTTLTAALKPLRRRGWVEIAVDEDDRRGRRLTLTDAGRAVLRAALPIWQATHARVERGVPDGDIDRLRADLNAIA